MKEINKDTLQYMYVDLGMSQPKIAKELGYGVSTVNRHMQKYGIKARNPSEARCQYHISKEMLKEMYDSGMSQAEIAKEIGCCPKNVCRIMRSYAIPARSLSEAHRRYYISKERLQAMYEAGLSQTEIAKEIGCSTETVRILMREYCISTRRRQYSINEDFFKMWKPESAWMYGWILGDGCFTDPNRLIISLSPTDKDVLYKFKDILGSDAPVKDYRRWDKRFKKYYDISYVMFSSRKLVSSLKNLSPYDEELLEFYDHFIRGFFEAEGCVTLRRGYILTTFANNNKNLLEYIFDWLSWDNYVVEGGGLHRYRNCWLLQFSHIDSISLYHYLYDNCGGMYMKRKKEKFEKLIVK